MSRRSDDGPEPAHEISGSSESALDLSIPSAEEAHRQIFWQENPSPRRPTVRIEVRNNVLRQGTTRQESFTYTCKALPYDAGFRPHAYVDNHEHTIHSKNRVEVNAMEGEDCITGGLKLPAVFRKLVGGKRMSKLMAFSPPKLHRTPKQSPDPQSPDASSAVSNPVTTNHPNDQAPTQPSVNGNCLPPPLPSSPPPSYPVPDKKRHRALLRKTWFGSRPLFIFVIPKPRVEGRVVPSPRELPICLLAGEDPPPLSPLSSP